MTLPAIDSLARFCAEQSQQFEINAWLAPGNTDRRTLAVVAKYLSMTSWYGHEDELMHIASEIHPVVADDSGFNEESQAIGFDLQNFSTRLRYRIALRRAGEEEKHT